MDHQLSENKLILLYIIHEKENIKVSDLYDFVLFRGYMDYFLLQNYLEELEETELILQVSQEGEQYYTTLPAGDTVTEMFRARIPHSIREDIRNYALNSELNNGSPLMGVDCDIEKIDDERFDVHCRVLDYDRAVMEFIKTAPDEEAANRIRNAWMKKGMSVYWNITKELN